MKLKKISNVILLFPFILVIISSCISYTPELEITTSDTLELDLFFEEMQYPYIKIQVQGIEKRLYIDIGCKTDIMSLSRHQFQDIKYKRSSKKSWIYNNFTGVIKKSYYYNVPEIKISTLNLETQLVSIAKTNASYMQNIGFLGWQFFKEFNFLIDYKNKKLILYDIDNINQIDLADWKVIDFYDEPSLSFPITFKGKDYTGSLDNGLIFLSKDKIYSLINIKSDDSYLSDTNPEILYNSDKYKLFRNFDISVGNNIISEDYLKFDVKSPMPYDFVLGGNFFINNRVYIDNKNNKIYYINSKN